MEKVVIIGAGQAGARAAQSAREVGFEGELVLVGAEEHLPYERPPLSKEYLRGESSRQEAWLNPPEFYDENDILLVTGTEATGIDVEAREVGLSTDGVLHYDRLLIATGAEPVRFDGAPEGLDGVFQLRTVDDCDVLHTRIHEGTRLVIAGGGWIGCEVAASASQLGANVTMLVSERFPLCGVLGPAVGSYFSGLHEDHGVEVLAGDRLAGVEGSTMVTAAVTETGRRIACDAVLVAIGVKPRVQLAERAGVVCDDGILTSAGFRTSQEDVFAVGDVARAWHPGYAQAIRVEHWFNAEQQGLAAGRALTGEAVEYREVPYFFSDQYEMSMEYSGLSHPDDHVVIRGDPADGSFTAIWIRSHRVVTAVMTVNSESHEEMRSLVGRYLTPEQAADESRELSGVSAGG